MATQTTEGTGPGSVSRLKPLILNGVVNQNNLSPELLSNLLKALGGTKFVVSEATLSEVSPENVVFDGDDDDDYVEVEIGFPVIFANKTYTSVYVGSNSYVTFGSGSDEYDLESYEDWANHRPGIYVGVADNSYQMVLSNNTVGEVGVRTHTIRFEGSADTSEDSDIPIVWEMTFHEADPSRINLNVIQYVREPSENVEGSDYWSLVADGNGYYEVFSAANLPKMSVSSEESEIGGKALDFQDQDIVVSKVGENLNVDTSCYSLLKQVGVDESRILGLADANKHVYVQNSGVTLLVPYNYDVPFPVGTKITVVTTGDNVVIAVDGSSTTIYSGGNNYSSYSVGARSVVHLLKTNSEEWYLYGENISATV